jgi:hypothetical protein
MVSPLALVLALLFAGVLWAVLGVAGTWALMSVPEAFDIQPTREDRLPSAAKAFFESAVRALSDDGFEVVANVTLVDAHAGISSAMVAFVRRETGEMGTAMYASSGGHMIGFDTQFADGSRIVTLAQSNPGIFPAAPHDRWLRVPVARDPRFLYEIHRCRVRAFAPAGIALDTPEPGAEIERMQRDQAHEIEWLLTAGYLRPSVNGRHHVTFKGAAIAAWRFIPPSRWIVTWFQRLRARAELRSLGFNAFPPVVGDPRP